MELKQTNVAIIRVLKAQVRPICWRANLSMNRVSCMTIAKLFNFPVPPLQNREKKTTHSLGKVMWINKWEKNHIISSQYLSILCITFPMRLFQLEGSNAFLYGLKIQFLSQMIQSVDRQPISAFCINVSVWKRLNSVRAKTQQWKRWAELRMDYFTWALVFLSIKTETELRYSDCHKS